MRVSVGELIFDVDVAGPESGEPVLLLHGFPQYSGEWAGVAALLHPYGCRTVAPDQRGYSPGARPAEVSAYAMAELVADALAIMDALGCATFHVVGHDWGGVVGWQLAARYPERVRTLTAVSVPHPGAIAEALDEDASQRERFGYIQLYQQPGKAEEVLLADDAARLRRMFTGCPPERVEGYVDRIRQPGALTAALNWYRAMPPGGLAELEIIEVPTTYVWSDADFAIGTVAAQRCAGYVKGEYEFVALGRVGHWIPDAAPEPLATAIVRRVIAPDGATPG